MYFVKVFFSEEYINAWYESVTLKKFQSDSLPANLGSWHITTNNNMYIGIIDYKTLMMNYPEIIIKKLYYSIEDKIPAKPNIFR